jgi:phosphatidylethanolamine-binding protein (PEBP) family uncharacterized protein
MARELNVATRTGPRLDRRALIDRIEDHVSEQARVIGTYEH